MNRKLGAEKIIDGASLVVSKDSQRNLEKAEELCRKGQPQKAVPYLAKAMKDDNNLDAFIQAAFLAPTLDDSVNCLQHAREKGRRALKKHWGDNCFDDTGRYVGNFWSLLETRPYMRVLQALVRLSFENKQYGNSADTIIEMLRLCPSDSLGQRNWLGSILLRLDRPANALFFCQSWIHSFNESDAPIPSRGGTNFLPPSQELLSEDREAAYSQFSPGALAYNAALAAYKIWGNSPVACQYLRIAAKVNPTVLMRILGRIDQPRNLNMDPRTMNGSEDAHDYLWLTQDLWMEPDVWNWANGNKEGKGAALKICSKAGCGKSETEVVEFKRCAACKQVSYCGQPCQKADWKTHKPKCLAHKQQKIAVRAFAAGKMIPTVDGVTPIIAAKDHVSFMPGEDN